MDAFKAGLTQRIFAWALARFNKRYEQFVSNYKRQLFAGIRGTVLEIGAGTGANLRYMTPEQVRWTGVELNPFMTSYLRREANRVNLPVSMLMVGGTDDKLNKWDGNPPKLASVPETFEFWCRHNQATPIDASSLAFTNDVDHFKHRHTSSAATTSMQVSAAVNNSTGAEVVLAKVVGGGHTWPGADQRNHLLRFICGPTHSLHSANEIIWSFFSNRP